MPTQLSALEARVIGCLIEKQLTTPDQYPLSLNALAAACNQKSNRDPVLDLPDRECRSSSTHCSVDLKDVVFYLSVVTFGLFLAHQSVESRRWRA